MKDSGNEMMKFDDKTKRNFIHEQDYEYSRETYYDLIEKGRESLELMIEVARESEHPRAFEVLSGMIKGIADVNDKLMDLNKKNKELNKDDRQEESSASTTTNNNLFIGSTTDLQRLLLDDTKVIQHVDSAD